MLVKTLISIAEKLDMDIDKLTINSLRFGDGYILVDPKNRYDITFSELNPVKESSLIRDHNKTSKIIGTIIDPKTNCELDLLAFLIKHGII